MKEKLTIVRNFLYRFFLIGIVLNILFQLLVLFIGGKSLLEVSRILELPPFYLTELLIVTIASIRAILIYFILCPALALHWTISRDKTLNSQN